MFNFREHNLPSELIYTFLLKTMQRINAQHKMILLNLLDMLFIMCGMDTVTISLHTTFIAEE